MYLKIYCYLCAENTQGNWSKTQGKHREFNLDPSVATLSNAALRSRHTMAVNLLCSAFCRISSHMFNTAVSVEWCLQ